MIFKVTALAPTKIGGNAISLLPSMLISWPAPPSVRSFVRAFVSVDLGKAAYKNPDFFHEVGDKYG